MRPIVAADFKNFEEHNGAPTYLREQVFSSIAYKC